MTLSTQTTPSIPGLRGLRALGVMALIGHLAPVLAMAISIPIARHDVIADTISDLGRGPHKWIMDTGFYLYALGMAALAGAAAAVDPGGRRWRVGVICLALLAPLIVGIGLWDHFHTAGDNPPGRTVHTWLTLGLAPLYFIGPLAMARDAGRWRAWTRPAFFAAAGLWIVFAAAFKLQPTDIDGLLEKIAVAATYLWTLPLIALVLARARDR